MRFSPHNRKMNRHPDPIRVTLSLWLVLFLTVWNALRIWTAIAWRNALTEFSARPAPVVSAIIGAVWLATGIILLWSISRKRAWAGKMLIGASAAYSAWYWIERLAWQAPRPNWPFAVILNLALLVFIYFTTKSMTREANEQQVENSTLE
jgi:hypothetical protein